MNYKWFYESLKNGVFESKNNAAIYHSKKNNYLDFEVIYG
jgi:hypothetical protein